MRRILSAVCVIAISVIGVGCGTIGNGAGASDQEVTKASEQTNAQGQPIQERVQPKSIDVGSNESNISPQDEAKAAYASGNYTQAATLTRPFADQGQAWAQLNLATMFEEGKGLPKDEKQAELWYRKAAAQGNQQAQTRLQAMNQTKEDEAKSAYEKGDYTRAATLTRPFADQGQAWAQFNLATMFEEGKGVSQDGKEAEVWYGKAAEQGHARAQFEIGMMEWHRKHKEKAKDWFLKAAEQGHAPAMVNLGVMFERMIKSGYTDGDLILRTGKGSFRMPSCNDVVDWYLKAQKLGSIPAMVHVGDLHAVGRCTSVNGKEAEAWYRAAADQGDVDAMIRLATLYEDGKVIVKNSKEALRWYLKAAERGDVGTQRKIGTMYQNGTGAPKNAKQAEFWYRQAAQQGDVWTQKHLGEVFQNGRDVQKDLREARKWYRTAAAQGDVDSMFRLAESYRSKKGDAQDLVHVYLWYSLAAFARSEDAIKARDKMEKSMSPAQIQKAQDLARRCQDTKFKQCE